MDIDIQNLPILIGKDKDRLPLASLTEQERKQVLHFAKLGEVRLYNALNNGGICVKQSELKTALQNKQYKKTGKIPIGEFIDLSVQTRLSCLFKRVATMNTQNKKQCEKLDIKHYVDHENYLCINLLDYLEPQINVIANKLEITPPVARRVLAKMLISLFLEKKKDTKKRGKKWRRSII